MSSEPRPDVIVIGGGVMGCAVALRLAVRGLRPLVLERSVPGAEASSVAAGILAPRIEHGDPGPATRIGVLSGALHRQLADELRERTGVDVGFRRCGAMIAATSDEEERALDARARTLVASGAEVARIDGAEARRREPELGPAVRGAIDLPEEAQVEPPLLLRALSIAAELAGARFRSGAIVHRVRVEKDRALGVLTEQGPLDAAHVVVAAGSWTSLVTGLPFPPGLVRPIRGQLLHTERRPRIASRIVFGGGAYVVPRADGRVICGATMEDVGFQKEVTLGGLAGVITRATRLFPALESAPLTSTAVSFRPKSPDELPLVGPAGPEGLWLATGHHRNGILLAPLTAALVAELIAGDVPSTPDAAALDPRRFLS